MIQEFHQVLWLQPFENKNLTPGEQSRIDLERRVFRSGTNKNNTSLLYKRQKSILLRLIEAMDLVHKQHSSSAHLTPHFRFIHYFFDLLDATCHRAEIDKLCFRLSGNNTCKSRFSHSRRSPKDHRRNLISLNELS